MELAIRELDIGELDLVAGGYAATNWKDVAGEFIKGLFTAAGTEAGCQIGATIGAVGGPVGAIVGGLIGLGAGAILAGNL